MSQHSKKTANNLTSSLFDASPRLSVIQARFEHTSEVSFNDLVKGYSSLRVLTYSTSLSLIKQIAEKIDDMEIVFGREDILHRVSQYIAYQDMLLRALKQEFQDNDIARQKIDAGKLRLFVVQGMISHEKLYLLEGDNGGLASV
jgi:hypothetical protein